VVVSNGEEALDYFYRRGKFAMRESGRQLGLSLAAVDESQPNMEKEGIGEVGGKIKEENLLTIFAKWV
jgi:hypothetical protein